MTWWKNRLGNAAILSILLACGLTSAAHDKDQERTEEPKRPADLVPMTMESEEPDRDPTRQDVASGRDGRGEMTTRGRVRTTKLHDRGRDVTIVEDPDKGILIVVTKHFDPDQLRQLKEQHPELRDYIDLFPTETGDHEIELSISLKKKFAATDAKRLKAKSLFAFGIYERHVQRHGDHLAGFGSGSPIPPFDRPAIGCPAENRQWASGFSPRAGSP